MSAESYLKLRKFTERQGEPTEDILRRAADQLRDLGEKATIHLRLIRGGSTFARSIYSVRLTPSGAFLRTESAPKPTLVVITTSEAFHRMAEGSYSPVEAYLNGAMTLLGNVDLARKIVLHLADPIVDPPPKLRLCPVLYNESWAPDLEGSGSLTLSGDVFTLGGTVHIEYNWGGGTYARDIIAVAGGVLGTGTFTVTEGGIPCGDIPNHPGVGVIVTAFDLSSGQSATGSYATPCQ